MDNLDIDIKTRPGRKSRCILILGKPGTGKSTLAYKLMKEYGRGLMVLPSYDDWADILPELDINCPDSYNYNGVKHHVYNTDNDFYYIYNMYHNGIACFDDVRAYIPSNFDYSHFKKMLIRPRQRMLDVIIMAHGFSEVPPKLFTFITDYVIMDIEDSPDIRKKYLSGKLDILTKTVDFVKSKAHNNPHYFKWLQL